MKFEFLTADEILAKKIPDITHLIEGLFEEDALIYIAGTPGSAKTMFMLFMALCGAMKSEMFGVFKIKTPFKTLIIDEENGLKRTKFKLRRLMETMGITTVKHRVKISCLKGFKIKKEWVDELEKIIVKEKPKAIVLDSFVRIFTGDERDERSVRAVHNLLKPLIEKYSVTIFILHHLRKELIRGKTPRTLDDIRGSSDIGGQCDQAFLLQRYGTAKDDLKTFKCVPLKEKDGIEGSGFNFKIKGKPGTDELRLLWDGTIEENVENALRKTKADIVEWLQNNGNTGCRADFKRDLNHGNTTLTNALKELVEEGILTPPKNVGRGIKKNYSLVLSSPESAGLPSTEEK
jgi:hypothetical protein